MLLFCARDLARANISEIFYGADYRRCEPPGVYHQHHRERKPKPDRLAMMRAPCELD